MRLYYGYVMVMLWLRLQLLCQGGESLCYGRCSSQEGINIFAVPTALQVSFQPLSLFLPTLGSANIVHSGIQQDNWRHKQGDQRCSSFPPFVCVYFLLLQFYITFFFSFLSHLCLLLKGKSHASEIFLEYSQQ